MKRNLLVLGVSIVAVITVALVTVQNNVEQVYVPRKSADANGIKGAFEYYEKIKADARTGQINPELILERKNQITKALENVPRSGEQFSYIEMGPSNVGGRTRALIQFEENPQIMFTAGVSGGVWKSTNGGNTWSRVSSFSDNLAVGAMERLGNGWIVVGTGCDFESKSTNGNNRDSGGIGNGMFISKDNGETWSLVTDDSNTPIDRENGWRSFHRIVADKKSNDKAWIAGNNGIVEFNFTTGAYTVKDLFNRRADDIAVSESGDVIIASYTFTITWTGGQPKIIPGKVFLSTDAGATFTEVSGEEADDLKAPVGRTTLAISPDNENYIYVLGVTSSGTFDGLYYSKDKGVKWETIWDETDLPTGVDPFVSANGQGNYNNALSIVPGEPGIALVAGVTLWMAGPDFDPEQIALNFASPLSPLYVHSDIHYLKWTNNNTLWIGCDGGLHKGTYDGDYLDFEVKNTNYNVTQFYEIGINGEMDNLIGGTQDNGTQFVSDVSITPTVANRVIGGDGFTCDLSTLIPDAAIGSVYNGDIQRSINIHNTPFSNFVSRIGQSFGGFYTLGMLYERAYDEKARAVSYTYKNTEQQELYPGTVVEVPSKVLSGTFVEHVLEDTLEFNQETDPFYDKTNVMYAVYDGSGIQITRQVWNFETNPVFHKVANNTNASRMDFSFDGNHLYTVGGSGVVRISGLRSAWTPEEMDINDPNTKLTRTKSSTNFGSGNLLDISVFPSNPDVVVVVKSGYNANGGHIFMSTNATTDFEFTSIDGNFPDIPAYSVEIDRSDSNIIFVGTEEGLYITTDGGQTWENQVVNGFERVPVFDIVQQTQNNINGDIENTGVVYFGTHGRGAFRTEDLASNVLIGVDEVAAQNQNNFVKTLAVYPNPVVDNTTIAFNLSKVENPVVKVMNLNGQVVKHENLTQALTGENKVMLSVSELPVGTYLVQLVNGTDVRTARFVKTR